MSASFAWCSRSSLDARSSFDLLGAAALHEFILFYCAYS